jgi:hypothetical protein
MASAATNRRQYVTDESERRGTDEAEKLVRTQKVGEDDEEQEGRGSEESVMEWQERMERRFRYDDITRQLYAHFDALHSFHHHQQQAEAQHDATTAEMMLNRFGFALTKRRSTIPNAGHGTTTLSRALALASTRPNGRVCVWPLTRHSLRMQVSSWRGR